MSDDELSSVERLVRIEEATNEDGTVEVEIFDWDENDGKVTVEMITPTNDKVSEQMPFPKPGGNLEQYKFYRLVRDAGLTMRNVELLEGKKFDCEVEYKNTDYNGNKVADWKLVTENPPTLRERVTPYWEKVVDVPWASYIISTLWVFIMVILAIGIVVVLL